MKKLVMAVVVLGAVAAGVFYYRNGSSSAGEGATAANGAGNGAAGGRGRRGGGPGGFGGGQFGRPPLTVELAPAKRMSITSEITVVGNLVGEATVSVAPRVAGRLQDISVRLGDRVGRGQRIARIEDFEIQEQVKQAEAALEVALATIRQREADLQLAKTNAERSRSLYERQLLPKQTLDDNEARYQSAIAALDLARAQNAQSKARLDELRINLANMVITSPVTGFVSKRLVDPGAFVSQNSPVAEVVDVTSVRLEANIVERDLKQLKAGDPTRVEVDAFPGEHFMGRIARVSPVLDPATRTAPIEIEIPNSGFRLKPGMYARVGILTGSKKDALVVPSDAVVDLGGRRGVFTPLNQSAAFRTLQLGSESDEHIEVLSGLNEGDLVITTGAGALRDSDRIQIAEEGGRRGGGPGRAGRGAGTEGGAAAGASAGPAGSEPRGGRTGGGDAPPPRRPAGERGSGKEAPAPSSEGGVSHNGRRGGTVHEGRPPVLETSSAPSDTHDQRATP